MTGRLKESGLGRPAFLGSANSRDRMEGPACRPSPPSPARKRLEPMATKGVDRWTAGISLGRGAKPMQAVGGLFAMGADAVRFVFRRPFQWREFLEQSWFVARVAIVPTLLVAIPFTVLVSFTLNILLRELGAADLSGAGAAFGAVTQVGPLVTVLIVAGAGATAMCADLGSRTIREEIDAMEVLGINPVQRLVAPRMLAAGLVALLLNSLVVIIGIVGGYLFSVFVQDVNPGAFAAGITLLTGVPEVVISCVKAALFGLIAGLVACYRGLTVSGGGAKAVGNAVNETVVFAFMALLVVNVVVTAIGIRMSAK
jgi:phospholipid/cholesterol/gamma-HCH transport system permease protein